MTVRKELIKCWILYYKGQPLQQALNKKLFYSFRFILSDENSYKKQTFVLTAQNIRNSPVVFVTVLLQQTISKLCKM